MRIARDYAGRPCSALQNDSIMRRQRGLQGKMRFFNDYAKITRPRNRVIPGGQMVVPQNYVCKHVCVRACVCVGVRWRVVGVAEGD